MIKFFRKIRYNLMEQNKTGKYFKYAIGEIVLVVIGILIALSINNWNEGRKGKSLAKQYAYELVRDIKQDALVLNYNIEYHTKTTVGLDTLLTFKNKDLNQPSINDSLYVLFKRYCTRVVEFKNNENTLNQLKSTGSLVLFHENIKESILMYEMITKKTISQGSFYRNAYINNTDISKKILDLTVFKDSTYFNNGKYTGKMFPKGYYTDNMTRELFNEIFLLNAIAKNYLDNRLKTQLEMTENLIELLIKEYELVENEM